MYTNPRIRRRQNAMTAVGFYLALSACDGVSGTSRESIVQSEVPSFIADQPKGPVFDLEQSREEPDVAIDEGNGVTTNYYYSPELGGFVNTYASIYDEQSGFTDSRYLGQMFCDDGQFRMYIPYDLSEVVFSGFDQVEFDELSAATCADNDQLSEADLHMWLDPGSADSLI